MEKIMTISYVEPENGDPACLMVLFANKEMAIVRNAFYGIQARVLYNRLIGTEMEIKSNMRREQNEHWLADAFIRSQAMAIRPAVEPFLLSPEQLEEILKEPVRKGPEALMHNKDCPYDYKCRDVDCIECIRIYTDEVDGLTSNERDKVNTVRNPD